MNGYDNEYRETNGLFWESKPAKYVRLFVEKYSSNLTNSKVLDIGAGEGKNAIYLASKGAWVKVVDVSQAGLSKLKLNENYSNFTHLLDIECSDALQFQLRVGYYDIVVVYGLLHALPGRKEILELLERLKRSVKVGGYIIIATFNKALPPPEVQKYLNFESFLSPSELKMLFDDWKVLEYEEEIITESHSTTEAEHQHAISRLLARKC